MSAIVNIGNVPVLSPSTLPPSNSYSMFAADTSAEAVDSVELSSLGKALSRATELSSLSVARVRAIRDQIANGTFETPERINGTVARLLDVIG